jgi:hypothetical protein
VGTVSEPARAVDLGGDETAAIVAGASGVLALLLGVIVGSRLLRVLGLVAACAGAGLYGRAKLAERNARIEAAERTIHSALDDLDPVARAQVYKDIAGSELGG